MVICSGRLRPEQRSDIAGGGHVGKDDVDVDAGDQDIMFGCASEENELRHASRTPDGNSFEEEIDRRAQEW